MKLKTSHLAAAVAMAVIGSGVAHAEGEFSGNVALSTDYTWRGISQSNGDPAISGGLDYANGSFYAGTWASNVDFGDASDTNVEVDFYGGITNSFANGVTWDVGAIYYAYPDSDDEDLDFYEIYGGLGYAFESGLEVGGKVSYDPDNKNTYVEASAAFALTDQFAVDAGVGNYSFDGGGDYTNFNVGGTYSIPDAFDVDVRYWSNDVEDFGVPELKEILDDRVVLTISRSM